MSVRRICQATGLTFKIIITHINFQLICQHSIFGFFVSILIKIFDFSSVHFCDIGFKHLLLIFSRQIYNNTRSPRFKSNSVLPKNPQEKTSIQPTNSSPKILLFSHHGPSHQNHSSNYRCNECKFRPKVGG